MKVILDSCTLLWLELDPRRIPAALAGVLSDPATERYLSVAYDMLFDHGLFHGDLHPGNVVVMPGELTYKALDLVRRCL